MIKNNMLGHAEFYFLDYCLEQARKGHWFFTQEEMGAERSFPPSAMLAKLELVTRNEALVICELNGNGPMKEQLEEVIVNFSISRPVGDGELKVIEARKLEEQRSGKAAAR